MQDISADILAQLTPEEYKRLSRLIVKQRILDARLGDLTAFAQLVYPGYFADAFHRDIHNHLMACARGEMRRLMISAPPQTGKSLDVSSIFPAFWVGQRRNDPVLLASYEAEKAAEYSFAARNIVESDIYKLIFPGVHTRQDSRARNRWNIDGSDGKMFAAGINGPLTGRGAMLAIIDDPIKGWEEAMSVTLKEKQWEWYKTVFRTRVWEQGTIIIVMTRWAEDDLVGRLLNSSGASDWTLLRYPALAEDQQKRDRNNKKLGLPEGLPDPLGRQPNERLTRYSQGYWEELQRDMGGEDSRAWAGLYDGVPRPYEGTVIKRAWFLEHMVNPDEVPIGGEKIRYWDKAGTEDGGARSAGVLINKVGADYYIEDVVFGQWTPFERNKIIKETASLDAARYVTPDPSNPRLPIDHQPGWNSVRIWIEQEPGSGGKESADISIQDLAGYPVEVDPPTANKDARLQPFQTQLQAGHVYLVRANWNEPYIDELTAIPHGMYRDMADGTSGAFNKLNQGNLSFGIISMQPDPFGDW